MRAALTCECDVPGCDGDPMAHLCENHMPTLPAPDVQAQYDLTTEDGWRYALAHDAKLAAAYEYGRRHGVLQAEADAQAQIDAAPNGYADRAFTDAEWATRYAEKCRERDVALAARDERAPFCEKHRADEQWRGLTDCLACATEELEARVTEFDSQIDAARAEEREACAMIAEGIGHIVGNDTATEVATLIRARSGARGV